MRTPYASPSLVALTALLTACGDVAPPAAPMPDASLSGASTVSTSGTGRYIVRFRDDVANANTVADRLSARVGARLIHRWDGVIKGMNVELPDAAVSLLRLDAAVASVEPDRVMSLFGTQVSPPWGLDRVDQRNLPLDNAYTYAYDGTGVTAYVIDTGIMPSHADFGGRASIGFDATGGTGIDCMGHGTHVAGILGGTAYGVAKNVRLVAIKVSLQCSGTLQTGDVITAVNWVTSNATRPAVVNMSLGGSVDANLDDAVSRSIASGLTYVTAAGNCVGDGRGGCFSGPYDACTISPARVSTSITVAATDNTDTFAYFANYGTCVHLNAPGVNIKSAWIRQADTVMSGTSMAAPHVAGGAAMVLQANPLATAVQVKDALAAQATAGVITGLPAGTPSLMLYTLGLNYPRFSASFTGPSQTSYPQRCDWSIGASGGAQPYTYSIIIDDPSFQPPQGTSAVLTAAVYTTASMTVWVRYRVTDAVGQWLTETRTFQNVGWTSSDPYCHY